jgi:hypothetical protein
MTQQPVIETLVQDNLKRTHELFADTSAFDQHTFFDPPR